MKLRMSLALAALVVAFTLAARADSAAVAGTWTAEVQGRNGAQTQTYMFKMDGGNLTGSVTMGKNDTPIADGKVTGDAISFSITREMRGNSVKMNYTGKVSGDEIKFTVKTEGRDQAQEITAKRSM